MKHSTSFDRRRRSRTGEEYHAKSTSWFGRNFISIALLLVAAGLIWTGLSGLLSSTSPENTLTAAAVPAAHVEEPALITAAIKDLRNGMRVLANNPDMADVEIAPLKIKDPENWRNVVLLLPKNDGGDVKITLLRPLKWLELHAGNDGKTIFLDMEEMGAVGKARVLELLPCPEIEPDDGQGRRLITGRFEHSATDVIDVSVEGEEKPIGTTTTHPFRSADRNAFVPAGELKVGEQLRLENGRTTRITNIVPRAGPEKVYNIEVEGQHVFYVGNTGVLVHNSCTPGKGAAKCALARKDALRHMQQEGIIEDGAEENPLFHLDSPTLDFTPRRNDGKFFGNR